MRVCRTGAVRVDDRERHLDLLVGHLGVHPAAQPPELRELDLAAAVLVDGLKRTVELLLLQPLARRLPTSHERDLVDLVGLAELRVRLLTQRDGVVRLPPLLELIEGDVAVAVAVDERERIL
jgi:hypothetical protein